MGNSIGSSFISSLRSSISGSTVVSQTSANPPLFQDPTSLPGVARAWVSFNGYAPPNTICEIFSSSTNIAGVTSRGTGEYQIGFKPGAFTNSNYIVTGSITTRERFDLLSAANTFFVLEANYRNNNRRNNTEFRIQTIYATASAGAVYRGPAYAGTVNLVIFK